MVEEDALNVDDKLNMIMDKCCFVKMPTKKIQSYKNLLEMDRLYVILAIREVTLPEINNKMSIDSECRSCGHVNKIEINKDSIGKLVVDDKIMKYFNPEDLCFDIKGKDSDNDMRIYLTTLGTSNFVKNWARRKVHNKQYLDEGFVRTLCFLVPDFTKLNDDYVKRLNNEVSTWSLTKTQILQKIIDVIMDSVSITINYNCESCGEEVRQDIVFPDGIKSLFIPNNVFDELI